MGNFIGEDAFFTATGRSVVHEHAWAVLGVADGVSGAGMLQCLLAKEWIASGLVFLASRIWL